MNYRHAYHAGSFADVFKHIILVGLITSMKQKDKSFRMIDTHGGIGMYDLLGEESLKTGEALSGIIHLTSHVTQNPWIQDYLKIVKSFNAPDVLRFYPGSPVISQQLIREQDKLQVCELHPEDVKLLSQNLRADKNVQVFHKDGYGALKGFLPPVERRALILIDPPFEDRHEFQAIISALRESLKRFATGVFAVWYPIKDINAIDQFYQSLKNIDGVEKLIVEYHFDSTLNPNSLNACGTVILNPPYYFELHLKKSLDEIEKILNTGKKSKSKIYKI